MRIGRSTFPKSTKKISWTDWKKMFNGSSAMRHELNLKGYTLETAYEYLTGKKPPVKKEVKKEEKKKEDPKP